MLIASIRPTFEAGYFFQVSLEERIGRRAMTAQSLFVVGATDISEVSNFLDILL